MSALSVSEHNDGRLVIDSRLIAERLGIEHDNFLQTVLNYRTQIEQAFGIILFQTGKITGRGRPQRYALLTEDQATFVMTLSRNTPEVVQCKLDLVKAFSEAKELLRQRQPKPTYIPYWYERMKVALSDAEKPLQIGYFCIYQEMMAFFCELETRLEYIVADIDPVTGKRLVPDISIGKRFNNFLRSQDEIPTLARQKFLGSSQPIDFRPEKGEQAGEICTYNHVYPKISHGEFNVQPSSSYPANYLMLFRYFLEQYWISDHFVPYLLERDPEGITKIRNRILQMSFTERRALSSTLIGRLVPALPKAA